MNPKELRKMVFNKYGGHCAYCGKELKMKDMQVDHIHPKAKAHFYGSEKMMQEFKLVGDSVNDTENLNPACRRCNYYKTSFTLDEFRKHLSSLHERLERAFIYRVGKDYGMVIEQPFSGTFYFETLQEEPK